MGSPTTHFVSITFPNQNRNILSIRLFDSCSVISSFLFRILSLFDLLLFYSRLTFPLRLPNSNKTELKNLNKPEGPENYMRWSNVRTHNCRYTITSHPVYAFISLLRSLFGLSSRRPKFPVWVPFYFCLFFCLFLERGGLGLPPISIESKNRISQRNLI